MNWFFRLFSIRLRRPTSSIRFSGVTAEDPQVESALRRIEQWVNRYPHRGAVNPRHLARTRPSGESVEALTEAFRLLVEAGYLKVVYQVETPKGVLAPGEWETPVEVEEQVRRQGPLKDPLAQPFKLADGKIVQTYKRRARHDEREAPD